MLIRLFEQGKSAITPRCPDHRIPAMGRLPELIQDVTVHGYSVISKGRTFQAFGGHLCPQLRYLSKQHRLCWFDFFLFENASMPFDLFEQLVPLVPDLCQVAAQGLFDAPGANFLLKIPGSISIGSKLVILLVFRHHILHFISAVDDTSGIFLTLSVLLVLSFSSFSLDFRVFELDPFYFSQWV